jgi:hypothetical protein
MRVSILNWKFLRRLKNRILLFLSSVFLQNTGVIDYFNTVIDKWRVRFGRGTWFDAAIFLANCWLVPRITQLAREGGAKSVAYGAVMLFSIMLYTLGAGLKRRPLQARLAQQERPAPGMPVWITLFVLVIMQFGLFMISFMIAMEAIEAHWSDLAFIPAQESVVTMLLALTAGAVPVCMTIRALMPLRKGAEDRTGMKRQELFADHALFFSAIISLSIWDGLFMHTLQGGGPYAWYMGVLLMVLITVPFAIFYASPRILFLAEDYRHPMTWVRIASVVLPLSAPLLGWGG